MGVASSSFSVNSDLSAVFSSLLLKPANNTLQGNYAGGSRKLFGGDDEEDEAEELVATEYNKQAYKQQESLLNKLIDAVAKAGLIKVDEENPLNSIKKQLPNPSKNTKVFSDDAKQHEKTCKVLASIINKLFPGVKVINEDQDPVSMCKEVSEVVYSFGNTMGTEYLAVHSNIKNTLSHTSALFMLLSNYINELKENFTKEFGENYEMNGNAHKMRNSIVILENIVGMLHRKKVVLENLLHVELPEDVKSLEKILLDNKELKSFVKDFSGSMGTKDFARALGSVTGNMVNDLTMVNKIKTIFKKTGLTLKEFTTGEFDKKINELKRTLDDKELVDLINMHEELKNMYVQYSHSPEQVIKKLRENGISGGGCGCSGGVKCSKCCGCGSGCSKCSGGSKLLNRPCHCTGNQSCLKCSKRGGESPEYYGGAEDYPKSGFKFPSEVDRVDKYLAELNTTDTAVSSIDKDIKIKEKSRQIIFNDFAERISDCQDNLVDAVKHLAFKINKESVVSASFKLLKDALTDMCNDPDLLKRVEYFLIGFNKDQHAVDIRNRFIRNLKHIAGACDELMGGKVSCITECAGLKTATQDYVKTIEEYNERVSKLAGDFLGEVKYELKRPVKVHTLQEAVASFDKNFYLAQIYANMEKSNKMIRDDGKDYLELIGKVVASEIAYITKERDGILKELENKSGEFRKKLADIKRDSVPAGANPATSTKLAIDDKDEMDHFKSAINKEYETKINFYKAIQFVDLYLKSFTLEITSKPSSIQELKTMLDGTEVIAPWYLKTTGDGLVDLFDMNFYEVDGKFKRAATKSIKHGIDFSKENYKKLNKSLDKTYDSFLIFKNLLNTFMRVGSLGATKADGYMGATRMYNIFMEYLKKSAYSVNLSGLKDPDTILANVRNGLGIADLFLNRVPVLDLSAGNVTSMYVKRLIAGGDEVRVRGGTITKEILEKFDDNNNFNFVITKTNKSVVPILQMIIDAKENAIKRLIVIYNNFITSKLNIKFGDLSNIFADAKVETVDYNELLFKSFVKKLFIKNKLTTGDITYQDTKTYIQAILDDANIKTTYDEMQTADNYKADNMLNAILTPKAKTQAEKEAEADSAAKADAKAESAAKAKLIDTLKLNLTNTKQAYNAHIATAPPSNGPLPIDEDIALNLELDDLLNKSKTDNELSVNAADNKKLILKSSSTEILPGANGKYDDGVECNTRLTTEITNAGTAIKKLTDKITEIEQYILEQATYNTYKNTHDNLLQAYKTAYDKVVAEDINLVALEPNPSALTLMPNPAGGPTTDVQTYTDKKQKYNELKTSLNQIITENESCINKVILANIGLDPASLAKLVAIIDDTANVRSALNKDLGELESNLSKDISTKQSKSGVEALIATASVDLRLLITAATDKVGELNTELDLIKTDVAQKAKALDLTKLDNSFNALKAVIDKIGTDEQTIKNKITELATDAAKAVNDADKALAEQNKNKYLKTGVNANALTYQQSRLKFGNYLATDRLFHSVVKSMCAKILMFVNVSIINSTEDESKSVLSSQQPSYGFNSEFIETRLITVAGGSKHRKGGVNSYRDMYEEDSSNYAPEIIPEASELYFRLVRLVEYYYHLFVEDLMYAKDDDNNVSKFVQYDEAKVNADENKYLSSSLDEDAKSAFKKMTANRIALIPELGGVFTELVRIVFVQAPEAKGNYSESECYQLIKTINKIYTEYKSKHSQDEINNMVIDDFIAEINRRYGVLNGKDIRKYEKRYLGNDSVDNRFDDAKEIEKPNNYAILPDEEKDFKGVDVSKAPSESYPYVTSWSDSKKLSVKSMLDTSTGAFGKVEYVDSDTRGQGIKRLARKFFEKVVDGFQKHMIENKENTKYQESYAMRIELYKKYMMSEPKSASRYAVKLIRSSNDISVYDSKLLMFHETVVLGLTNLNVLYKTIVNLRTSVCKFDLKLILDIMNEANSKYTIDSANANGYAFKEKLDSTNKSILNESQTEKLNRLKELFNSIGGSTCYIMTPPVIRDNSAPPIPTDVKVTYKTNLDNTTNADNVFTKLFEALYQVDSELIEVKLYDEKESGKDGVKVEVIFTKMKQLCEYLISHLRTYFDLFRSQLDKKLIMQYEGTHNTQKGTFLHLEYELLECLFSDGGHLYTKKKDIFHVSQISKSANFVLNQLLRADLTGGRANFYNSISEMVYYNKTDYKCYTNTHTSYWNNDDDSFVDLIQFKQESLKEAYKDTRTNKYYPLINSNVFPGDPDDHTTGRRYVKKLNFYKMSHMTTNRSLLFSFNQIVARFINTFVDKNNGNKIYSGLINNFVNGVGAGAVNDPVNQGYPDFGTDATHNVSRGDPELNNILFKSLGYVLQRLTKDVTANQTPMHLVNTLSEVPLYMKESLRCNLPQYVKLFELLINRAKWLKEIINRFLGDRNHRTGGTNNKIGLVNLLPDIYQTGLSLLNTRSGNDKSPEQNSYLLNYIDNIMEYIVAFHSGSVEVLKELNDSSNYMDLSNDFTENYVKINGKYPLTPLSLTARLLDNMANGTIPSTAANSTTDAMAIGTHGFPDESYFPNTKAGEHKFKFMYGTKALLYNKGSLGRTKSLTMDTFEGIKVMLENYNSQFDKRYNVNVNEYLRFTNNLNQVFKFVVDNRHFKPYMISENDIPLNHNLFEDTNRNNPTDTELVKSKLAIYKTQPANAPILANLKGLVPQLVVYELIQPEPTGTARTQYNMSLVSNEQQTQSIEDIIKFPKLIAYKNDEKDRTKELYKNLRDMNKVPIDVHALMKYIPLVNLYNYEFVFDSLINKRFKMWHLSTDVDMTNRENLSLFKNKSRTRFTNTINDNKTNHIANLQSPINNESVYQSDTNVNEFFAGSFLLNPYIKLSDSVTKGTELTPYIKSFTTDPNNYHKIRFISDIVEKSLLAPDTKETVNKFNTTILRNMLFMTLATQHVRTELYNKLVISREAVVSESHSLVDPLHMQFGRWPEHHDKLKLGDKDQLNLHQFSRDEPITTGGKKHRKNKKN